MEPWRQSEGLCRVGGRERGGREKDSSRQAAGFESAEPAGRPGTPLKLPPGTWNLCCCSKAHFLQGPGACIFRLGGSRQHATMLQADLSFPPSVSTGHSSALCLSLGVQQRRSKPSTVQWDHGFMALTEEANHVMLGTQQGKQGATQTGGCAGH